MFKKNRFRLLLCTLPMAALAGCFQSETTAPSSVEAEKTELTTAAFSTTWKIGDYWCMSFDGDKGTMKLTMTDGGESNRVAGTIDWKRREDVSLDWGEVYQAGSEVFYFQLRTKTTLQQRIFRASRSDGNSNLLKGTSSDARNGANIKLWSATRGKCL